MSKHKGLGKLQDCLWHIGYITKDENDPRRHRSRCAHYRTDGSCTYNSHCIGSAHCAQYEDTVLKKQVEEYRANRKTWKELAPQQPDMKLVQLDDVIEIYSFEDDMCYNLDFRHSLKDLPDLHKECLGRAIGSTFQFRGEKYKIKKIISKG